MSILLAGGGDREALRPIVDRFVASAQARAGGRIPRVAVIVAGEHPDAALHEAVSFGIDSRVECVALAARTDESDAVTAGFDGGELLTADGILVADGAPAALLAALADRATDLRRLVHERVPYLGIGAGAVVASEAAILGGDEIGGVRVAPAGPAGPAGSAGEVRVEPGLGLIDMSVLGHAAQRGLVGLGVACCESGLVETVLALDEGTALEVSETALELLGRGSLWQISAADGGVRVESSRAEEPA
ncbi:Type 1 glutamine amidotransferase-like domain-containing protein [Gulosibacter sp. 10]|uniref:Type 1 glutamine amidotransferase-like domain-containing protein n=1 Tax=Gulosibacter sp. 10 TaxID=1255570 RepID=UPI001596069C|nr:Type 1 glutamine amidotransferase-like domain-containing protein [Gulosibacter sp. 10]